ncbi:MAG: BUD32 family EKC/KEOPS complex subunit [Candidatus Syntropharchaeales archaeon]
MPWVKIGSKEGLANEFKGLSSVDQKRLLPRGALPINILDIDELEATLNGVTGICPGKNGIKKEVVALEGYYPPKFGIWATHRLYRVIYTVEEARMYVIAKQMTKRDGDKEFWALFYRFYDEPYMPVPYYFLYDSRLEREFKEVFGYFWMQYIEHDINFEEYLLNWTIGKIDRLEFYNLGDLLRLLWSKGVKHNDLKGEHLLLKGDRWHLIDFEKFKHLKNPKDREDDLSILIGDSTLFLDGYMRFHRIEFEGEIKKRYEEFVRAVLGEFGIDIRQNPHFKTFLGVIRSHGIRESAVFK